MVDVHRTESDIWRERQEARKQEKQRKKDAAARMEEARRGAVSARWMQHGRRCVCAIALWWTLSSFARALVACKVAQHAGLWAAMARRQRMSLGALAGVGMLGFVVAVATVGLEPGSRTRRVSGIYVCASAMLLACYASVLHTAGCAEVAPEGCASLCVSLRMESFCPPIACAAASLYFPIQYFSPRAAAVVVAAAGLLLWGFGTFVPIAAASSSPEHCLIPGPWNLGAFAEWHGRQGWAGLTAAGAFFAAATSALLCAVFFIAPISAWVPLLRTYPKQTVAWCCGAMAAGCVVATLIRLGAALAHASAPGGEADRWLDFGVPLDSGLLWLGGRVQAAAVGALFLTSTAAHAAVAAEAPAGSEMRSAIPAAAAAVVAAAPALPRPLPSDAVARTASKYMTVSDDEDAKVTDGIGSGEMLGVEMDVIGPNDQWMGKAAAPEGGPINV